MKQAQCRVGALRRRRTIPACFRICCKPLYPYSIDQNQIFSMRNADAMMQLEPVIPEQQHLPLHFLTVLGIVMEL